MKKAFDANVSRARPKLRLGAMMESEESTLSAEAVEALAQSVAQEPLASGSEERAVDLSEAVKARLSARSLKPTAAEALSAAIEAPSAEANVEADSGARLPPRMGAPLTATVWQDSTTHETVVPATKGAPVATVEAPAEVQEVQTAPSEAPLPDAAERRDRLRERLRAVRENPRPQPLPETVAEAGVLAVERIATLQSELAKTRAVNLALSQDLEAARRQAERATEEARLRMDEARRLSEEMQGRAALLTDLERELSSLEGERNEALLALQEARQAIESQEKEKSELRSVVDTKNAELEASLQEEERLASELEAAHDAMAGLRRTADALKTERDTLARQVADLTKERMELLEARKALEAVHRALAKASALA
jgi:uncharacterized coiled-coil DUF342 family protein